MNRNLKELVLHWTNRQFLMRSGYYAGRGPLYCDLNSKMLEEMYAGLKKDVGKEAASNFACFVNTLEDLSASAFIVAFEAFWENDCKIVKFEQRPEDGDRYESHEEAFGFLAVALTRGAPDERRAKAASWEIKSDFIRNHKKEIETAPAAA